MRLLIVPLVLLGTVSVSAANTLTVANNSYSQNFNGLASTGTTTTSTPLTNWVTSRTNYLTGTGSVNTGGVYSFGAASASDRALGSLASNGTGTIHYGTFFSIVAGTSIFDSLTISYTGEQWRNGGNTTAHKLDFAYRIGSATEAITDGTWTDFNALDFTGPVATASAGSLDGNLTANRVALSQSILSSSLSIGTGQVIWIRWSDVNDDGNDHGLAIDDLTVTANFSTAPAAVPLPTAAAGGLALAGLSAFGRRRRV